MENKKLTAQEKSVIYNALCNYSKSCEEDLERFEKEPEWAEKWNWLKSQIKQNLELTNSAADKIWEV